jgi:hypothetical protein
MIMPIPNGWFAPGAERFSDETTRVSAWVADSGGTTAKRIGCMTDGNLVAIRSAAASASAIFLAAEHLYDGGAQWTWEIVKMAR